MREALGGGMRANDQSKAAKNTKRKEKEMKWQGS